MAEGVWAAEFLALWGIDALEISQGLRGEVFAGTEFQTDINTVDREGFFREWCKEVKRHVPVPTIMMGGLRSFELLEKVVQKGEADCVSMSRPFIRDPGLINAWKSGDRHRATCISCNKCLGVARKGEPIYCVADREQQKG